MAEEGAEIQQAGEDFTQQIEQHEALSESVVRGEVTIEAALPQLFDVIPLGCKDVDLLERNAAAIYYVLTSVKEVKESYITCLESNQQDWLLMYVYKGLGASENKDSKYTPSAQIMFKWFNTINKVAGEGCVMRAVSRRRAL